MGLNECVGYCVTSIVLCLNGAISSEISQIGARFFGHPGPQVIAHHFR